MFAKKIIDYRNSIIITFVTIININTFLWESVAGILSVLFFLKFEGVSRLFKDLYQPKVLIEKKPAY